MYEAHVHTVDRTWINHCAMLCSYYLWQIGEDFGDNNVFVSCEVTFMSWKKKLNVP